MGIKDFSHDMFKKGISELSGVAEQKDLLQQDTQELWEQLHLVERAIHHNLNDESKYQKEAYKYFDAHNEIKDISTEIMYYIDNILWLTERFPDGKYADVIGLCKVAKIDGEDGIIDQDYSLNAGRYVGVVIEDDGMTQEEFTESMRDLHREFEQLNNDAMELSSSITDKLKELVL
jgi:type I restriction enzyme M protein